MNQPNTNSISGTWPDDESVIAPYWSDINIELGGDIWYRQTEDKDGDVIKEATKFIKDVYRNNFCGVWAMVVTWDAVAPFSGSGGVVNSFQAVLVSDAAGDV